MALGDPYVSVSQFKVYLGIGDVVDDTAVTDAVTSVSREIEKFCGRQFNDAGSATARVFRPDHAGLCQVDDFSTVTGLVVATDGGDDGTYETTWAASSYQLEPLNGVVDGESGWPWWRIRAVVGQRFPTWCVHPPVQVTARWGWTAVPAAVKQAALILAAETFKLKDAPFGVAGYGDFGPIRVRSNPMAAAKLAPYRRAAVLVG